MSVPITYLACLVIFIYRTPLGHYSPPFTFSKACLYSCNDLLQSLSIFKGDQQVSTLLSQRKLLNIQRHSPDWCCLYDAVDMKTALSLP